jgi:hypothetical protein
LIICNVYQYYYNFYTMKPILKELSYNRTISFCKTTSRFHNSLFWILNIIVLVNIAYYQSSVIFSAYSHLWTYIYIHRSIHFCEILKIPFHRIAENKSDNIIVLYHCKEFDIVLQCMYILYLYVLNKVNYVNLLCDITQWYYQIYFLRFCEKVFSVFHKSVYQNILEYAV